MIQYLVGKQMNRGLKSAATCFSRIRGMVLMLALSLLLPSVTSAGETVRITLAQAEVSTTSDVVKIGDVVEIEGSTARVTSNVASLDLDQFAGTDSTVIVTQEQIRIRLVLAGIDATNMTLSGVDQVRVKRIEVVDVSSALEATLTDRLATRYHIEPSDLVVRLDAKSVNFKNQVVVPSTLQIIQTLPADLPLGQKNIAVQLTDSDQQKFETRLNARIAVVRNLVIARRPIRKGEVMSAENVESVRRPIDSRRVRFASFEQVVGKQSRVNVNQYDLIKSTVVRDVATRSETIVKKNALMNVIVRRGPLEVVLKGARAIDAGNPGDQIALLNPHTREQIVARIIDGSTAEVRY